MSSFCFFVFVTVRVYFSKVDLSKDFCSEIVSASGSRTLISLRNNFFFLSKIANDGNNWYFLESFWGSFIHQGKVEAFTLVKKKSYVRMQQMPHHSALSPRHPKSVRSMNYWESNSEIMQIHLVNLPPESFSSRLQCDQTNQGSWRKRGGSWDWYVFFLLFCNSVCVFFSVFLYTAGTLQFSLCGIINILILTRCTSCCAGCDCFFVFFNIF